MAKQKNQQSAFNSKEIASSDYFDLEAYPFEFASEATDFNFDADFTLGERNDWDDFGPFADSLSDDEAFFEAPLPVKPIRDAFAAALATARNPLGIGQRVTSAMNSGAAFNDLMAQFALAATVPGIEFILSDCADLADDFARFSLMKKAMVPAGQGLQCHINPDQQVVFGLGVSVCGKLFLLRGDGSSPFIMPTSAESVVDVADFFEKLTIEVASLQKENVTDDPVISDDDNMKKRSWLSRWLDKQRADVNRV